MPLRCPSLRRGDTALSWGGSGGDRYRARAEHAGLPRCPACVQSGRCPVTGVGQPGGPCLSHARCGDSSRVATRMSPSRHPLSPHGRPTWRPRAPPRPLLAGAGQRRPRGSGAPSGQRLRGDRDPQKPHGRVGCEPCRRFPQPCPRPARLCPHAEARPGGSRPLSPRRRCWRSGL